MTDERKVFIHGWLGEPSDWDTIKNETDLCYCLPGHAQKKTLKTQNWFKKTLEDLNSFTKHLDTFHLIGYSLGGRVALSFAEKYPKRIKKLSLISSHLSCKTEKEIKEKIAQEDSISNQLSTRKFNPFLKAWYKQRLFQPLSEAVYLALIQKRKQQNQEYMLQAFQGYSHRYYKPKEATLEKLAKKVQLIVGEKDTRYMNMSSSTIQKYPGIALQAIPNCGHAVIASHAHLIKHIL